MSPEETAVATRNDSAAVAAARERYVARGIATTPLVVERAEGALLWDADGREYVDFAGGLGCQNTGHGLPTAVAALAIWLRSRWYERRAQRGGEVSPKKGRDSE